MNEIEKKIRTISKEWFYTEPVLFSIFCTHNVIPNQNISVPIRTGAKRIEYSPLIFSKLSDSEIEEYLKVEMFRILLGHPYARQPYNCQKALLILASDVTVNHLYKAKVPLAGVEYFKDQSLRFKTLLNPLTEKWAGSDEEKFFMRNLNVNRDTGELETIDDLTFEEWYKKIFFLISELSAGGGENAGHSAASANFAEMSEEYSELWEENQEAADEIKSQIQKAEKEQGWGGIGGNLQRTIKQEADFSMDYRRILTQFRANVITAARNLTRMRPNRRYGFKAMGCRYERKANILAAVDVSGSITDESLSNFFHVINNFFVYGIEKLDVIFFDTNLKYTKPVTLKKRFDFDEIKGKGGTNFQAPVDFFSDHPEYNGLIIFTDGEGNPPSIKKHKSNMLWILDSRIAYEKTKMWIAALPGNKSTYLPF